MTSPSTAVPAAFRDLLDTAVATLATNTPSGQPQLTAVWFLHDEADDKVKISINSSRRKLVNLRLDPHATFFILDPANPFRTLEIRGTVEIEDDSDYTFAGRLGAKYGADLSTWDGPEDTRSVVTLNPTRVVATNMGG